MGAFAFSFFIVILTLSFAFGEMSNEMKVEEGNDRAVNTTYTTGCCSKISSKLYTHLCYQKFSILLDNQNLVMHECMQNDKYCNGRND